MSVSSGSDITIPIQDSPPPPPSPYAGTNGGSKGNNASTDNKSSGGVGGTVTIIDTSAGGDNATAGKSTPEPRGDVTVTVGFVNEAYQDHSPDHPNHRHSEKNGHTKMTNGQKKNSNGAISISVPGEGNEKGEQQEIHLNEAVNPELINMNILNTIPDKPNPEYGPYDNLDEYFVPVNQHKKFLRSEKLYVTKDKRKETHWKKYICWVLGASILAAIVTVAVLAGIGLIPQKSPNHFDSVVGTTSATESSSGGDLSSEDVIISSSPESSLPSSTEINTPPSVPVDATYVPMAADIHFHITDLSYESALNDKTSDRFQELASEVQDEVKDILKRRAGLRTVYSRVTEFAPGSVFVKMRIGWLDQAMDYIKVRMTLSNVTAVGNYNIMPIRSYEVVNLCKFNKNGCSHNCSYSYIEMDFICSCGNDDSLVLAEDKKTCRSMYEATSSTTSEIPLLPEFSSYSPLPVSEEESSPVPPSSSPSSEEILSEVPETETHSDEPEQPTSQPEEDHSHHESEEPSFPTAVSHEIEPETSTEADLPSDTIEPVSHEHHHDEAEMIPIFGSSTTSTSTTEAPAPVSEEIIEADHRHHDEHQPIIVPVETTTPSITSTSTTPTPEPLPILIGSSEEPHHHEEETTSHVDIPAASGEAHSQEEEEVNRGSTEVPTSAEHHVQPGLTSSEELGSIDMDESVKPTDPVVPLTPEVSQNSSENATILENVRNVSPEQEEEQHDPQVVPTEVPEMHHEEIGEATVSPPVEPSHEEVPVESPEKETKSVEDDHHIPVVVPVSTEEEATTSVSDENNDEVPTTVVPDIAGDVEEPESEQGESHDITPMDVLSFSSKEPSSTTTTPTPIIVPVHSAEQNQGRSASSSIEGSSEVETLSTGAGEEGSSIRSQNLSEGEDESATETNRNRAPRLFSTEMGHPTQLLTDDQEKSGEREETIVPVVASHDEQEIPRPSQNVTESASVETADENPETASAVTKTSSEDTSGGASRESATLPIPGSESESSQSQSGSGSNENNNVSQGLFDSSSQSESSELSQESPVAQSDSDSGERTTFAPLSLHHDIDINFLGNNTEDHTNSEPVQPLPEVEIVQDDNVANQDVVKTNDKLMVAPVEEEVPTTAAPIAAEREELASQSQEESPERPASGESSSESRDETPELGASAESNESRDENSGTTTRGITTSAELFGSEEALESPNRDHRDTEADIETPAFSSRISDEEVITTEVPLTSSSTTTTTTTSTTTSTTTTTTTAAPVPEVILADLTVTSTTTTVAPVASTNDTRSSSDSSSDSLSQESSGSQEGSSSHLLSQEGFSSSSPEDTKSVSVEPTLSAASYEAGPSTSLESHDSSSSDDDLHHNELTESLGYLHGTQPVVVYRA